MTEQEMMKEALEWQEHIRKLTTATDDELYHKRSKVFDWLINRVEELEKINKKLIESTTVVANENHCYKLALEFYANKKNYNIKHLSEDKHEIPVFKDYGEKARNALECDEN
jgi:hypothetical protein